MKTNKNLKISFIILILIILSAILSSCYRQIDRKTVYLISMGIDCLRLGAYGYYPCGKENLLCSSTRTSNPEISFKNVDERGFTLIANGVEINGENEIYASIDYDFRFSLGAGEKGLISFEIDGIPQNVSLVYEDDLIRLHELILEKQGKSLSLTEKDIWKLEFARYYIWFKYLQHEKNYLSPKTGKKMYVFPDWRPECHRSIAKGNFIYFKDGIVQINIGSETQITYSTERPRGKKFLEILVYESRKIKRSELEGQDQDIEDIESFFCMVLDYLDNPSQRWEAI
ncbi:MAG: hypothetical protein NTZ80_04085 [Patescibacteria group bacterium]|nr:hypothetical protein [Patescibacteria group bacterium]